MNQKAAEEKKLVDWSRWRYWPIIMPLLRLLKSSKGITLIALACFELVLAYTGEVPLANATQVLVVLALAYVLGVTVEDGAAKLNGNFQRLPR